MLDANGDQFWGPGVTASFDTKLGRSDVSKLSASAPVATPTSFAAAAAAGVGFPDGTYYLRVAAGDRNNDPFTVSAASAEISVALSGGNNRILCTWVASPTNPTDKYTIYVGTTPGGENKAQNTVGSPQTLLAMPAPNQVPNEVGTLLSRFFDVSPASFKHSFGTNKFATFTCPITADRTITFPDGTFTVAAKNVDNAFSTLQSFAASAKVGTSGTSLSQIRVYTPTLTPAACASFTSAEQTFAVVGITTADKIIVNGPSCAAGSGIVNVRASNTDEIAIMFMNTTAGPVTPTAGVYSIVAIRS
jgi:hypothetical protein